METVWRDNVKKQNKNEFEKLIWEISISEFKRFANVHHKLVCVLENEDDCGWLACSLSVHFVQTI